MAEGQKPACFHFSPTATRKQGNGYKVGTVVEAWHVGR